MGKGGGRVQVNKYYMSQHLGVCAGPVSIKRVIVKEKEAWVGTASSVTTLNLDVKKLFGGSKKEGGVAGTIHVLPGASDQLLPDVLAQKLGRANGADCPGFRGLTSLFFVGSSATEGKPGFYWSANSPYLPTVWVTVSRAPSGIQEVSSFVNDLPFTIEIPFPDPVPMDHPFGYGGYLINWNGSFDAKTESGDEGRFILSGNYSADETLNDTSDSDSNDTGVTVTVAASYGSNKITLVFSSDEPLAIETSGSEANSFSVTFQAGASFGTWSPSVTNDHGDPVIYTGGGATTSGDLRSGQIDISTFQFHADSEGASSTNPPLIGQDANPAWIIYESLTNTDWGMGSPATLIDEASFTAAADTLDDEEFGLSMIWTRQAEIQDFVQEVLDHIQAVLFVDPATGLLTLKLIRGDYDVETLPDINPSNAILTDFSRKLWGEITNEITVTWTNPQNEQEETITVQDLASIVTQGGIVPDGRNYYGVRNANLAKKLAQRDLRSSGAPLASCNVEVNRTLWEVRPASVVTVTWPEYGLAGVVMRATSVDYGRPGDMTIKIALVEDVFGLDVGDYVEPPGTIWEDPSSDPEPVEDVAILTVPYYFARRAGDVSGAAYPEVVAGVLAGPPNADTYAIELWDQVSLPDSSSEWQELTVLTPMGHATLEDDLPAEAESEDVSFAGLLGETAPAQGVFALIGTGDELTDELVLITGAGFTLSRGVLDTVPRAWAAGTKVWFLTEDSLFLDPIVRAAFEEVSYKLLPSTSRGTLDLAAAALETHDLTERPWLPSRPANVIVYGTAFSDTDNRIDARARPDPWVTTSWANRNRLTEDAQVLAWTDSTVTPETGQTTRIQVLATDGVTELADHTGLAGTGFDVPDASFGTENAVRLRFFAERMDDDGEFVSLQFAEHWVQIDGLTFDEDGDTWDSDMITWDSD